MLKEILSPESCAKCRLCCGFDREDMWENPVISSEIAENVRKKCPGGKLNSFGKQSFAFELDFGDKDIAYCPALSETGCTLGEDKPFDCKIWPYRVMEKEGRLVLTLSPVCSILSAESRDKTAAFAEKLAPIAFAEAKKNPDIIKKYIEGYPILAEK